MQDNTSSRVLGIHAFWKFNISIWGLYSLLSVSKTVHGRNEFPKAPTATILEPIEAVPMGIQTNGSDSATLPSGTFANSNSIDLMVICKMCIVKLYMHELLPVNYFLCYYY